MESDTKYPIFDILTTFCGIEISHFDSNFIQMPPQGLSWQYVNIGSGSGLVLSRRQTITWTNDEKGKRRHVVYKYRLPSTAIIYQSLTCFD